MTEGPTLTLHDIADVARVQRSAVSMWRLRPSAVPFPPPLARIDGAEHFDRDAVVEYLRVTGRGSNPHAALDAVAFAVPRGVDVEEVVTLLALQSATGVELGDLTSEDLSALADQADPGDDLFLAEIRAITPTEEVTAYLDDLVESSYGPADALARLDRSRLRRGERGVTEELVALVAVVVGAARDALGGADVTLAPQVDPTSFGPLVDDAAGLALAPDQRGWRRRALISEVDVLPRGPAGVHVLSVVDRPHDQALAEVDELLVELGPGGIGVVVGTASTLCDQLVGDVSRRRTALLDEQALAAAIRLPRGLWKAAHRQSLGLWVLHGSRNNEFVSVADLEGAVVENADLASDVAAALMDPTAGATSGARAPRYARRSLITTVVGRAAVVPRGTVAVRLGDARSRSQLERIQVATLTTSRGVAGCDVTVVPSPGAITSRRRSLGELVDDRLLLLRRGVRIDQGHADPAGTVVVQSADGSFDDVRLDPFDAAQRYPRATRTEPNDIVVLERPRPRARVDVDGSSMVAAPSRILRLLPGAPIGPHTLAAVVTTLATAGTAWETWTVPVLPGSESTALDAALALVAKHHEELRRHLGAAEDLLTSLIEGVAAGAVTLDPTLIEKEAG